jgi:hypothetical protein
LKRNSENDSAKDPVKIRRWSSLRRAAEGWRVRRERYLRAAGRLEQLERERRKG